MGQNGSKCPVPGPRRGSDNQFARGSCTVNGTPNDHDVKVQEALSSSGTEELWASLVTKKSREFVDSCQDRLRSEEVEEREELLQELQHMFFEEEDCQIRPELAALAAHPEYRKACPELLLFADPEVYWEYRINKACNGNPATTVSKAVRKKLNADFATFARRNWRGAAGVLIEQMASNGATTTSDKDDSEEVVDHSNTAMLLDRPEICRYGDVMTKDCVEIFFELELNKNKAEYEDTINRSLLPKLQRLNQDLSVKWVHNNPQFPLPSPIYYGHPEVCVKKVEEVEAYFQSSEVCLSEYNRVSLRLEADDIRSVLQRWLRDLSADDGFKQYVIPIIFNLLKRGESWSKLQSIASEAISEWCKMLSQQGGGGSGQNDGDGDVVMGSAENNEKLLPSAAGNDNIKRQIAKAEAIASLFTPKALFHFVFLRAETPLKLRLLMDFNTLHALPLIHPGQTFNGDLFFLLQQPYESALCSFGLGARASEGIGKSTLINRVLMCTFAEKDSGFFSFGSLDVDLGFSFKAGCRRRKICVADQHGQLDCARFGAVLQLFSHWCIHVHWEDVEKGRTTILEDFQKAINGAREAAPRGIIVLVRDVPATVSSTPLRKVEVSGTTTSAGGCDARLQQLHERFVGLLSGADGASGGFSQVRLHLIALHDLSSLTDHSNLDRAVKYELEPVFNQELCASGGGGSATTGSRTNGDDVEMADADNALGGSSGNASDVKRSNGSSCFEKGQFLKVLQQIHRAEKDRKLASDEGLPSGDAGENPNQEHDMIIYKKVDDFASQFFSDLQPFKNDFYDPCCLASRRLLTELREQECILRNPELAHEVIQDAKTKKDKLLSDLRQIQPTSLYKLFVKILQNGDNVLILGYIGHLLKAFNECNTRDDEKHKSLLMDRMHSRRDMAGGVESVELREKVREVSDLLQRKRFSLELLWRELYNMKEFDCMPFDGASAPSTSLTGPALVGGAAGAQGNFEIDPVEKVLGMIKMGEPFEIIDGDTLSIPKKTLAEAFGTFGKKRVLVVSILGPQSSGKSTLLNFLFGCKFFTSGGRCTKGVYGSCIELDHPNYDMLMVIDTEGLKSPEKGDPEFDRKITLFCLAVSNLVIINVNTELDRSMQELLEICIYSLDGLNKAKMAMPQVFMVFNKNASDSKAPYLEQINKISESVRESKPDAKEAADAMMFPESRLVLLPFAFECKTDEKDSKRGRDEEWERSQPSLRYAKQVAAFSKQLLEAVATGDYTGNSASSFGGLEQGRSSSVGAAQFATQELRNWISMSADTWKTIQNYPDLYRFANMKLLQQNHLLLEISQKLEDTHLTCNDAIARDQKALEDAVSCVEADKILSKKYQQLQETEVRSRIQEHFDAIGKRIEKELKDKAKEKLVTYDHDLMEQYQKKARDRVRCHCEGQQHNALLQLQQIAAEKSREKGVAQLDQMIEKFTSMPQFRRNGDESLTTSPDLEQDGASRGEAPSSTPLSEEEKVRLITSEFDVVWNDILAGMHKKLHLAQDQDRLWTLLRGSYGQHQEFPLDIFCDSDFEKTVKEHRGSDEILQKMIMDRMFASGNTPCMDIGQSDFINPALEDLPDLMRHAGADETPSAGPGNFLSPADFYDPYYSIQRFNWSDFVLAVKWKTFFNDLLACVAKSRVGTDQTRIRQVEDACASFNAYGFQVANAFIEAVIALIEDDGKTGADSSYTGSKNVFSGIFSVFSSSRDARAPSEAKEKKPDELFRILCSQYAEMMDHVFQTAPVTKRNRAVGDEGQGADSKRRKRSDFEDFAASSPPRSAASSAAADSLRERPTPMRLRESSNNRNLARLLLPIPNFAQTRSHANSNYVDLRAIAVVDEYLLKSPLYQPPQHLTHVSGSGAKIVFKVRRDPTAPDEEMLDGPQEKSVPDFNAPFADALKFVAGEEVGTDSHDIRSQFNLLVRNEGRWRGTVFKRFREIILREVDLSRLDTETEQGAGCASSVVANYSVHLTRLVRQRCSEAIDKSVSEDLRRFGWKLDMDGMAHLHFYALVTMWSLISDGSRARSVRHIEVFEKDREPWLQFVIKSILSDPRGQSEIMAERVMDSAMESLGKDLQKKTAKDATEQMQHHAGAFSAVALQESLDSRLPFCPTADSNEVVRYLTDQAAFIQEEFEKKWKETYQSIKARFVAQHKMDRKDALSKLLHHLAKLKQFLGTIRDDGGTHLFAASSQRGRNCFDVNASDQHSAVFAFFIDSCVGNNRQSDLFRDSTTWVWDGAAGWEIDGVDTLDTWGSVPFVKMPTTQGLKIVSFDVFCEVLEARCLKELKACEDVQLDIQEMGLDTTYFNFKETAIGCTHCCPACGRKCDQPGAGEPTHRHSCKLGHQMRVMAGVSNNGFPSFLTCDEIKDDAAIKDLRTRKWTTWKEIKKDNPLWDFDFFEDAQDKLSNVVKFRSCWEYHGKRVCDYWTKQGKPIKFSVMKPRDMLLIVLTDVNFVERCVSVWKDLKRWSADAGEQYVTIVHSDANRLTQMVSPIRIKDFLEDLQEESDAVAAMQGSRADEQVACNIVTLLRNNVATYLRQKINIDLPNRAMPEQDMQSLVDLHINFPDIANIISGATLTDPPNCPYHKYWCSRNGVDPKKPISCDDPRKMAKQAEEYGKKAKIDIAERVPHILEQVEQEDSLLWAWQVLGIEEGTPKSDVFDVAGDLLTMLEELQTDIRSANLPHLPGGNNQANNSSFSAEDVQQAKEKVGRARDRLTRFL
ncbi:unnamed protein product [Amoebophrya sp. A120]|nr:unnamed protein product [Amoebophrya sp. A120]|eukprot:GSA120T00001222001.1